jgi:hypothetical protein
MRGALVERLSWRARLPPPRGATEADWTAWREANLAAFQRWKGELIALADDESFVRTALIDRIAKSHQLLRVRR